nr:MAG TPA: hypothetical protein [Caudoviricetes sp.]
MQNTDPERGDRSPLSIPPASLRTGDAAPGG